MLSAYILGYSFVNTEISQIFDKLNPQNSISSLKSLVDVAHCALFFALFVNGMS